MIEKLFPYQVEGAKWLATKKYALLADEMGLGKSAQAIRACDLTSSRRILVLCPAVARLNWMREFAKFSTRALNMFPILSAADAPPPGADGLICSYDLVTKAEVFTRLNCEWDTVILDESHYLKNRNAKRTESTFTRIVPLARRAWCLSGTPAPNDASELFPMLRTFGAFRGDYWAFLRRFCKTLDTVYGTKIVGNKNVDQLRALLAPITLRRRKEDVLKDLPPIMYSDVVVEPSPVDVERWYPEVGTMKTEATLRQELAEQQAAIDAVVNITGLGKDGIGALAGLQTRCAMTRRYVGLQKAPAVAETIKGELESGAYDKIVIFCMHRDVITYLRDALVDFRPVTLFGGTPPEKRDQHIRKFQTDKKTRVFIGQIVAAGTNITLTAAHQVAFVEASWVPAENAQAAMRCHRIGQTKPVTVRFFSLANSSDEAVQKVLRRKTKDITEIFDADRAPLIVPNPFAD